MKSRLYLASKKTVAAVAALALALPTSGQSWGTIETVSFPTLARPRKVACDGTQFVLAGTEGVILDRVGVLSLVDGKWTHTAGHACYYLQKVGLDHAS